MQGYFVTTTNVCHTIKTRLMSTAFVVFDLKRISLLTYFFDNNKK